MLTVGQLAKLSPSELDDYCGRGKLGCVKDKPDHALCDCDGCRKRNYDLSHKPRMPMIYIDNKLADHDLSGDDELIGSYTRAEYGA